MESMYLKAEDLQKFWNEHRSECGDDFFRGKMCTIMITGQNAMPVWR